MVGSLYPDPHLSTFDGLFYSFQTAGEFVLVKDTNGGTFQVQARLAAPVGASTYSVITEIGIQVGTDDVTIDSHTRGSGLGRRPGGDVHRKHCRSDGWPNHQDRHRLCGRARYW